MAKNRGQRVSHDMEVGKEKTKWFRGSSPGENKLQMSESSVCSLIEETLML